MGINIGYHGLRTIVTYLSDIELVNWYKNKPEHFADLLVNLDSKARNHAMTYDHILMHRSDSEEFQYLYRRARKDG